MALALLEDDQWDWGDMEAPDGSALTKGEKAAAYADLMRSRCDCAVVLVESGAPVDWTAEVRLSRCVLCRAEPNMPCCTRQPQP